MRDVGQSPLLVVRGCVVGNARGGALAICWVWLGGASAPASSEQALFWRIFALLPMRRLLVILFAALVVGKGRRTSLSAGTRRWCQLVVGECEVRDRVAGSFGAVAVRPRPVVVDVAVALVGGDASLAQDVAAYGAFFVFFLPLPVLVVQNGDGAAAGGAAACRCC